MVDRKNDSTVELYIPIANLEPNRSYEQIFLVGSVKVSPNKKSISGNGMARVKLVDVTGEIHGIVWEYKDTGVLKEGEYVRLNIATKVYRDNLEFQSNADQMSSVEEPPANKYDYIRGVSQSALVAYAEEIEAAVMDMEDQTYRDVLCNAMHRLELLNALGQSPYGIDGSMSYRGGLIVHVAHAVRFCKVAIQQAREMEIAFNPSLVIAGCILRNVGWNTTTVFQGDYLRPRDAYFMTGIQRASARYIDHLMLTCESDLQIQIPESKKQALENMCNERANIRTLEGQIVASSDNMADLLDFGAATLVRKQNGNWSDELFVGHL